MPLTHDDILARVTLDLFTRANKAELIRVRYELEDVFKLAIPDEAIARCRTLKDLAEYLTNRVNGPRGVEP